MAISSARGNCQFAEISMGDEKRARIDQRVDI
jgi:hypothetical protein